MSAILYFAYGSNVHVARLRYRVPAVIRFMSACPALGFALLPAWPARVFGYLVLSNSTIRREIFACASIIAGPEERAHRNK